jgi:membrane-associated phospholipid phosphatase
MKREGRSGRRPSFDLAAAAAGITVFVACAFVVSSGAVGSVERSIFEAINGLPGWIERIATAAQFAGTLIVGPIVALVALAFGRLRLAVAALFVTAGKLLVERIVWELVVRERPGTTQLNAIIRGDVPTAGPSFVSGHVVLTTALAWVVTPSLPRAWRAMPWTIVAVVAFARIYLGAHNPLDVVGGAGLGIALGALVEIAVRPAPIRQPSLAVPPAAAGAHDDVANEPDGA